MRPALIAGVLGSAALGGAAAWAQPAAQAAPDAAFLFQIAPQPLFSALNAFSAATGWEVGYAAELGQGVVSPGVTGRHSAAQALARLLAGTGLSFRHTAPAAVTLLRVSNAGGADGAVSVPEIDVTTASASGTAMIGSLPGAYAGGQVARGGQLGLLGNRDFMDTPFNTTAYTAQTIRNLQARSIADVVANDPSIRIVSPVSNGSEVFNMRGFSVANQDVTFGGLYGVLPFWRGSVASAERIEVLRGPNALLNGMAPGGSVGGGINVVPMRAGEDPMARVSADYASDSNFGGRLDLGRRFGPDNAFGVRVNGVYRNGDLTRTSQEHGEATIALDYRGERVRLSLDLGYQSERQQGTEGLLGLAANLTRPPPVPDVSRRYYQPWSYWNSDAVYGVLRGEFDITPDLTVYAAFGGRNYSNEYILPFGSGLTAQGNFVESAIHNSEYYDTITSEVGLRGRVRTGFIEHRFSLAATAFEQISGIVTASLASNPSNIYTPRFLPQPSLPGLGRPPRTGYLALESVAVADTLSVLDDRVQLLLGLRQQQVRARSYSATTGARTAAYNESALTPVIGLTVRPWRNISFYGNYIEGLSQGGTAPAGTRNAGEVFAPFISRQYEAGIKVEFERLTTTLSAFQIQRPSSFTDPATNTFVVNGEQRNRGLELNIFGEPIEGVRVLGGAMLLDATTTRTAAGSFDGKTATGAPRWSVNIGGEWDLPFIPNLTLSGRMIYTSAVYLNQANTQQIPGWTRFDIGARYRVDTARGPVVIQANIENLLDRAYWMSSSLYRGAPRTFLLSTSMQF